MNPMTWNDLQGIADVSPLDGTDIQCLDEIKQVLQKYNKVDRFGVALLHQHFRLADDELLVEHCDAENRTLITKPEKDHEYIANNYIPTVWRFDRAIQQACSYCPPVGEGAHYGYKEKH